VFFFQNHIQVYKFVNRLGQPSPLKQVRSHFVQGRLLSLPCKYSSMLKKSRNKHSRFLLLENVLDCAILQYMATDSGNLLVHHSKEPRVVYFSLYYFHKLAFTLAKILCKHLQLCGVITPFYLHQLISCL
jgi:hypothetical protein